MGSSSSKLAVVAATCWMMMMMMMTTENPIVVNAKPWGVRTAILRPDYYLLPTSTSQRMNLVTGLRGGDEAASTDVDAPPAPATAATSGGDDEPSLDEKVYAAMKKLGLSPPPGEEGEENIDVSGECKDGVCPMPGQEESSASSTEAPTKSASSSSQDPHVMADAIAKDMEVDSRLAMAAIGATSTLGDNNQRIYHEQAARDMIQYELDLIEQIPREAPNVQTLVEEGFDPFLSRRALAFAENNMEDARAILVADQMDEEEEEEEENEQASAGGDDEEEAMRAQLRAEQAALKPDMVEVKTNFDPTALPTTPKAKPAVAQQSTTGGMPKPASKESVVFEATTAQIQELVLESPVPVLLDIYADWCGPCKVLGPALEEMAIKAGGVFRLVKVNSDNERPVSGALEVTALPTVYGVRDGKIVHMFQGMPRSENMMKNFMMGLFGAAPFSPPVTAEESKKYEELTCKLVKTAGAACFSFSARERLNDRINTKLDDLVQDDSVADVEGAAELLRTLMNNIVRDPYEMKYRKVNLENKMIASKLGNNANALAVLKFVGFDKNGSEMVIGKGKKVINVAPLVVARDCIDKWIQKNRNEMAAAARKRRDEADRVKVQAELAAASKNEGELEDDVEEEEVDPTVCSLKLRLDGKKKVHEVTLNENDPLSAVLGVLNVDTASEEDIQITCVAKRLVIKSSDTEQMQKSLKDHGLMPAASIVVKIGGAAAPASSSNLKERAAEKKKKKGSHTMQSVGIYAKDDNNKAELIDGGGGVWYEHDVSDDEEDAPKDESAKEESASESPEKDEDNAEPSQETETNEE